MPKPEGKFRCLACGLIWDGSQLFQNPQTTREHYTCGDLFCGANVVPITHAVHPASSQKNKSR